MATFDEVKQMITGAMSNPDTLEASMTNVIDTLEADYGAFANMSKDYEAAQGRIRDLQDTNHKLFLSQVGTPDDAGKEEPEPVTGPEVMSEFVNIITEKIKEKNDGEK